MKIRALQIGMPETVEVGGKQKVTGFCKRTVAGPVHLGPEGPAGNGVADTKHHGGVDKAICCYPHEHYAYWEAHVGHSLGEAAFGENFTTEGATEETVHIGDRFRVGSAVVEVTQPRQPCSTLAFVWERKGLVKEVEESGRTGFYLRVVEEGEVATGDAIEPVAADPAAISVAEAYRIHRGRRRDPESVRRLLSVAALSASWREDLERSLQRE